MLAKLVNSVNMSAAFRYILSGLLNGIVPRTF